VANQCRHDGHRRPDRPSERSRKDDAKAGSPSRGGRSLGALFVALASRSGSPAAAQASSHREAPLISEDPSADNTDTYAFRSPDRPDTVTIISNYIPGEDPAAGPNWYTFSPSARYVVYADKNGDGKPDVTWRLRFTNQAPVAFLQNTQQSYTVTRVEGKSSQVVGSGLLTPPDNIDRGRRRGTTRSRWRACTT